MQKTSDCAYNLHIRRSAESELLEIDSERDRMKIVEAIFGLAGKPRPSRHERIEGPTRCRLRVGHYRVLYEIDDTAVTVTIVRIRRRRFGSV